MFDLDADTQVARLRASLPKFTDWFGEEVAISPDGSVVAVSSLRECSLEPGIGATPDTNDEDTPCHGAVWLFVDDGGWTASTFIKPPLTGNYAVQYGHDLALSDEGASLLVADPAARRALPGVQGFFDGPTTIEGTAYLY